ncbi:hypothetical protein TNCV_2304681 [Trichonephila clavipes]|nr:hypothetical protein TNCV_2304681 [Trichonephila clavipes]
MPVMVGYLNHWATAAPSVVPNDNKEINSLISSLHFMLPQTYRFCADKVAEVLFRASRCHGYEERREGSTAMRSKKKEKLLTWVGVRWGALANTAGGRNRTTNKGCARWRSQCTLLRRYSVGVGSTRRTSIPIAHVRSSIRVGAAPHRRDLQRNFRSPSVGNAQLKVG